MVCCSRKSYGWDAWNWPYGSAACKVCRWQASSSLRLLFLAQSQSRLACSREVLGAEWHWLLQGCQACKLSRSQSRKLAVF